MMNFDRNGTLYLSRNERDNIFEFNGVSYILKPLSVDYEGSKGGNSSVFIIEDPNEDAELIIKVCKFDNPKILSSAEFRRLSPFEKKSYQTKRKRNFRFSQEIEALKIAKEDNFVNIVEIFFSGTFKPKDPEDRRRFQFFVMEKADTDLKEFILSSPELDAQERISICIDVMKAVKELHGKTLYHRDIKPDNILLFSRSNDSIKRWKLSDLGLIQDGKREDTIDGIGERIGPYGWLSPEAMNKALTERARLGFDCSIDDASDVFQLGKVFWFIFQGNVPIGQIELEDFRLNIDEKFFLFNIIKNMLNYNKARRSVISNIEDEMQLLLDEMLIVKGL